MNLNIAFIDVDTQRDFMLPVTGALPVPGAEALCPNLAEITQFAIDHKIPILKTMDTHPYWSREFNTHGGIFPPHCIQTEPGWMPVDVTAMRREMDCRIFCKDCYDVFDPELGSPSIESALAPFNFAMVYGVATDYCVRATVLGLIKRRLKTLVFSDAIAGVAQTTTDAAIKEMIAAGAIFEKFHIMGRAVSCLMP